MSIVSTLLGLCSLSINVASTASFTHSLGIQLRVTPRAPLSVFYRRSGSFDQAIGKDGGNEVQQQQQPRRKKHKTGSSYKYGTKKSQRLDLKSLRLRVIDYGGTTAVANALFKLQNAKIEREVIEAGAEIEALRVDKTETREVQGLVVRAAALSGLMRLAISTLYSLLDAGYVPGPVAYIPVFLSLRKMQRIATMEEVLGRIATACLTEGFVVDTRDDRKPNAQYADESSVRTEIVGAGGSTKMSIVAVNTYIASLCDIRNFDSAINLLRPGGMSDRFGVDPDICSYNTILTAAAKARNNYVVNKVMDLLKERDNIEIDIVTINSQLRVRVLSQNHEEAIILIDEILEGKNEALKPDKYTVDLALVPLAREGRLEKVVELIDGLGKLDAKTLSAFLTRLVDSCEIEAAEMIFNKFLNGDFPYCQPMARHFNIMIDGFSTIENRGMDAASLLRRMVRQGISPDAYTLTSFIKNSSTVTELKHIWVQAQERYGVKPTFINYVAYITSLGRLLDPSQACIVFDEMEEKKIYRSVVAWNALLGTISQPENSLQTLETGSDGVLASEVNGLSGSDASKKILQMMKGNLMYPNPNSQTFCLVATALANNGAPIEEALDLFYLARDSGFGGEGRFINAIIRCYGSDINAAMKSWRFELGREVQNHNVGNADAKSKNMKAAYLGLIYVCGKAGRADIALRIVYVMVKESIEPDENTLNSFIAGKRKRNNGEAVTMDGMNEQLMEVECTKYNPRDKRRESDQRIRIII